MTATPLTGSGSEAQYVFEGGMPKGVQQLVLGLRVNLECGCSAPSDFRVRSFLFQSGDVTVMRDFSGGLDGWGLSDPSAATIEDGQLHVHASAGQALLVNSAPIGFQLEDEPFKLTVTATVSPISAGSGYFAAIFLGARELSRARIPIAPPNQDLGTTITGDDGQFLLQIPALAPADYLLHAAFAGDQDLWPAWVDIKLPNE